MPYIPQKDRARLDPLIAELAKKIAVSGELNYAITRLVLLAVRPTTYDAIADGVKALEMAKLEYYRRVAAPYEDSKRKLNGDAY